MVKNHSDSEKGNSLPPHRLLFPISSKGSFYMHNPTDRIAHTMAFVTPIVEHWLEWEIAQWVHPMKDRSDDPSHHEQTLLPRSYISLHTGWSALRCLVSCIDQRLSCNDLFQVVEAIHINCRHISQVVIGKDRDGSPVAPQQDVVDSSVAVERHHSRQGPQLMWVGSHGWRQTFIFIGMEDVCLYLAREGVLGDVPGETLVTWYEQYFQFCQKDLVCP